MNPDAICYEPVTKKVFAFNGRSGTASVIDAARKRVAGEILLDGKPEFAQADGDGSVYDALEDKSEVVRIDAAKQVITGRWTLPTGSGPSAMAIDPVNRRVLLAAGIRPWW
jgi:DNA-binding beta-propeller fold protein YncE